MTQNHAAERELLARLRIKDGVAYWRERSGPRAAGSMAGSVRPDGYVAVGYRAKVFRMHRVLFLHYHGYLPEEVDHIDGNPTNNCVANLRAATHAQNTRNAKIRKNSTSGVKNVRRRGGDRWEVRLRVDGRCVSFGCFASLADASAVAAEARETAFGEFARHA
jgi:hypothetical protein